MNSIKIVKGLNWDHMAISNSEWTGVKLRDVLAYAGLKVDNVGASIRHVQFEGIDKDMVTNYGSSIPIHTVCWGRYCVFLFGFPEGFLVVGL